MLSRVDAQQALADLTEISSQIQAAVVFDDKGTVAASTFTDDGERGAEFARAAADLLAEADGVAASNHKLVQLEIATLDGSVFLVREGKTRIAATTGPEPTVGLVFYDLKSCLRGADQAKPKRTRAKKAADET